MFTIQSGFPKMIPTPSTRKAVIPGPLDTPRASRRYCTEEFQEAPLCRPADDTNSETINLLGLTRHILQR